MNNVTLIGRLTRDPEVRYTAKTQMAVARFAIAIDRPTAKDREKITDFPNILVLGKQAENCERFLTKGSHVGIQGRIQTGSYKNKNGDTVYTTEVLASYVEFLDWRNERADDSKAEQRPESVQEGFEPVDEEDIPF